jgi:SAM-dependent methyltransferase
MQSAEGFYDNLAPFYDLIFSDWGQSIERQGSQLSQILNEHGVSSGAAILDVSCGIGTQAIGLARLGYLVTGSDLSLREIERARQEAAQRQVRLDLSVADMRNVFDHHKRQFDVVLSGDNSIPHLLADDEILKALRQFFMCTKPGGLCLITLRDYEKEDLQDKKIRPYGVHDRDGTRYLMFQVWDVEVPHYQVSMYYTEDRSGECSSLVFRTKYYMVAIDRLKELMIEAGFSGICRVDGKFYQPVIIGRRDNPT